MKGFQTPRIQSPSSNAPSHSLLTEALRSGVVPQATRNKARVCKHPDSDNHTVMAVSLAATVGCCRLPDASQFLQQTQRYLMCVSETLKCGNILMCSACLSIPQEIVMWWDYISLSKGEENKQPKINDAVYQENVWAKRLRSLLQLIIKQSM